MKGVFFPEERKERCVQEEVLGAKKKKEKKERKKRKDKKRKGKKRGNK